VQGKLTRRKLAAVLALPALRAAAQPLPPNEALDRARGEIRLDVDLLKKFPLPPAAEPATVFRP
jgi:hypothetical protein